MAVDQGVLIVRAERPYAGDEGHDWLTAERPHGVFSRQLFLGDQLDTDHIGADYTTGSGRRFSRVWDVPARTGAIGELADLVLPARRRLTAMGFHVTLQPAA